MMLLVPMPAPRSVAPGLLVGALLVLIALAGASQAGAAARCYGAASRDHEHPCLNRQLLTAVAPPPLPAPLEAQAPGNPLHPGGPVSGCWVARAAAPGP